MGFLHPGKEVPFMSGKTGSQVGRPPKFTSTEEIQEKIDAYFKDCEGYPLTDSDGNIIFDKFGHPVIMDKKPLTVTGLALALGFTSRQALLYYQGKKAFREVIEKAKLKIENYAEMRLYDKDGSNGAKFNLQNNFRNWDAEKAAQDEGKAPAINIICDIPREAVKKTDTEEDIQNARKLLEGLKETQDG